MMKLIYDDAMHREIEKARMYEADIQAELKTAAGPLLWWGGNGFKLRGNNHIHTLTPQKDVNHYSCTCDFYYKRHVCSHVMTLERLGICPVIPSEEEVYNRATGRLSRLYLTPIASNNYLGGDSRIGIYYVL